MAVGSDAESRALADCADEPIHIPGCIQPWGALIGCDAALSEIRYASENLPRFVGFTLAELLGSAPTTLLSAEQLKRLQDALTDPLRRPDERAVGLGQCEGVRGLLDASAFRVDEHVVIEFTPTQPGQPAAEHLAEQLTQLLDQIDDHRHLPALLDDAVIWLRRLTGVDQVMAFKLLDDGSGEVVAESVAADGQSFLGLRFPQWDIPPQAREMMLRTPLRVIADIEQPPVDLASADPHAPPLDISLATVRGVSPVHIQYLANMGTRASMTLTIMSRGKLWGMFSFKHREAYVPSTATRTLLLPFLKHFNLKLSALAYEASTEDRERERAFLDTLRTQQDDDTPLGELLATDHVRFLRQFEACGLALQLAERAPRSFGLCPPPAALEALIDDVTDIVSVDSLAAHLHCDRAVLGVIAGALIIPLGGLGCIVLFREETASTFRWAGEPKKDIRDDAGRTRLSPRGSFGLYLEERRGQCTPWSAADRSLAHGLGEVLIEDLQRRLLLDREILTHRTRQQKVMINELNHRVRNILALIRAITRQARSHRTSLDSYAAALEKRIEALAKAHDLSSESANRGVSLSSLVSAELAPFEQRAADGSANVRIHGDDAHFRPDMSPLVALVVHEMTTNATKYGALSITGGRIEVAISREAKGVRMRWVESGGPPVVAPEAAGFGTTLIRNAVPFELDGTVDLHFHPQGVEVVLWLPESALLTGVPPTRPEAVQALADDPSATPPRTRGSVLVVEDNSVMSIDLQSMMETIGFERVTLASNEASALQQLDNSAFDFVVLDINLNEENSYPIARRLKAAATPFLFLTGYGTEVPRPDDLADVVTLTKPADQAELTLAIDALLHDG
ncbi:MAG: HWE histidine kinase domain-containing protein [Pseudomonadota bacterium]